MSDVLYSKLRIEVPSALNGENATITSEHGNSRVVQMTSPITDVMLAGMEKYRVQAGDTDENVSLGYGEIKKIQVFVLPESLESATWQEVSDVIKAGAFSLLASVGATKSFVINNKTYHAEVVAINDGTGASGQWYPANTVDFICTELYETAYKYNSTETNDRGFANSNLKNTLNNTIYPLLPSDLKNVIINKSHEYNSGDWTDGYIRTLATKLWLPTYYELRGTIIPGAFGESPANNKKYTLNSKIKTRKGQSSASYWWTGTMYTNDYTDFYAINTNGGIGDNTATNTLGVPICFRVG